MSFFYTLIFQNIEEEDNRDGTEEPHVGHLGTNVNTTASVKILLYSYMRSGSTFTGELFEYATDTFYLFEPVEGMYNELYGMTKGMKALDLFYYFDGTKR